MIKYMSVEQPNVIDVIGIDEKNNQVILTISDHLIWGKDNNHLLLLQEKINAYLRFIESGEITDSYPKAKSRHPVIKVRALYEPDREALKFLAEVKKVIEAAGFDFQFEQA